MKNKVLTGLGVFLVAVVLVQSVFLYRMSEHMSELRQGLVAQQSSDATPAAPSLSPNQPSLSFNDPDWSPFKEMQRMQQEMNKVFGSMRLNFGANSGFDDLGGSIADSPKVAVTEDKDKVTVTADIPGADKSNINVSLKDEQLTISATTQKSKADNSNNHSSSEQFIGKFEQSVTLPAPVLAAKMKTDYKDGVLTVTIPKA